MIAKRLIILVLVLFISPTVLGAKTAPKTLLPDGFPLTGIDGKLARTDSNQSSKGPFIGAIDRWFFEFDSDLITDRGFIKAGTSFELLPSAALEKMTTNIKERSDASPVRSKSPGTTDVPSVRTSNGASYRLWGRVTKYQGKNFIFAIYFLPLSKIKQPQQITLQKPQQQPTSPTINEPDDQLLIPEELIAKLTTRPIVRPEQLRKGLQLKQDSIFADRTGLISSCVMRDVSSDKSKKEKVKNSNTQYDIFVLDALGRNVQPVALRLLPCETLERTLRIRSAEPDPVRFKIAGILTQYKGNFYLLLQRVTRVYSHGNFAR